MNTDISNRKHIETLVENFYSEAMEDETIGAFFTSVVTLNLDKHLPKICDFWESVLLGNPTYKGNPMQKHIELSKKKRLEKNHFDQWILLWTKHVDLLFEGDVADQAKSRAIQVAALMQFKIQLQANVDPDTAANNIAQCVVKAGAKLYQLQILRRDLDSIFREVNSDGD